MPFSMRDDKTEVPAYQTADPAGTSACAGDGPGLKHLK